MMLNLTDAPFIIPSVIFIIVSLPLVLGIIPRNRWYGIRTARTISDDKVWFSANRLGGLMMILSSFIYILIASLIPYVKTDPDNFGKWAVHLAAFVMPLAASISFTLYRIKRF